MKPCTPAGARPLTSVIAHTGIERTTATIPQAATTIWCGHASTGRRNDVSRQRCRLSPMTIAIGWRGRGRPVNSGIRRPLKADTPSAKSSVRVASDWSTASSSSCRSSVAVSALSKSRFVSAIPCVGISAHCAASSAARAGSSSSATTSETRPHSAASVALSLRPELIHSNARA